MTVQVVLPFVKDCPEMCPIRFRNREEFKQHMAEYHPDVFLCKGCFKTFAYKSSLEAHKDVWSNCRYRSQR